MDFAFHGIHAKFLNANSYVQDDHYGGEKTLDVFKHMTTHIQNTTIIESILVHQLFQTMHVWHEFEIITEAICMVLNSNFTMCTKLKHQY